MSSLPDNVEPVKLAFEWSDKIFEGEFCKDIIDEWQALNELHATITSTVNPTAPARPGLQDHTARSGIQNNNPRPGIPNTTPRTHIAGTEKKRTASSEMGSTERPKKVNKRW
jgi:hypothetical protein